MILLKNLTDALFFQFCGYNPLPTTGSTLYLKEDNVRLHSTAECLTLTDLRPVGSHEQSFAPVYEFRFQGPSNSYQRQRELLEKHGFNIRTLMNHLHEQYMLSSRYHHIEHPSQEVKSFTLSYSRLLRIVRVKTRNLPINQVFSPFSRIASLTTSQHKGRIHYDMSTICENIAVGNFRVLDHCAGNRQHTLDHLTTEDIPYSLSTLEILPLLVEGENWQIKQLGGGIIELRGPALPTNQPALFLQKANTKKIGSHVLGHQNTAKAA